MVDLIYGRGITDIIHETPFYFSIFKKYASIKLLHAKPALYGSVDIINVCNLHCTHCYWWLNRKENDQDLSAERWREIIKQTFKKQHIYIVTALPRSILRSGAQETCSAANRADISKRLASTCI